MTAPPDPEAPPNADAPGEAAAPPDAKALAKVTAPPDANAPAEVTASAGPEAPSDAEASAEAAAPTGAEASTDAEEPAGAPTSATSPEPVTDVETSADSERDAPALRGSVPGAGSARTAGRAGETAGSEPPGNDRNVKPFHPVSTTFAAGRRVTTSVTSTEDGESGDERAGRDLLFTGSTPRSRPKRGRSRGRSRRR
ncbi:hypothetical protein Ade02nite_04620 [Paractinoplanes deccanensis]|uniref:Uncharacterized protein n=1 Tax=Paractinoplanes deccanensis TaxID=113561 RepID=A0ABQ3XVQ0_9ACTN|nr:hypothetical protein Ade02nite_04620 [Actinoplanes deccanensis]